MTSSNRTSVELLRVKRRYQRALLEGDSRLAGETLDRAVRAVGPRRLYLTILAPVQAALGEKWLACEINVAGHHLATQMMLTHLQRLRELMRPKRRFNRGVVVSTPSGEHHTLGARMVADFLYSEGLRVDFLGGGTPIPDLVDFIRARRPDAVALSITLTQNLNEAAKAVAQLRRLPDPPRILAGGRAVEAGFSADAIGANAEEAVTKTRSLLGLEKTVQTLDVYLRKLGRRIQTLRKARGWNQQRLADAAGLDRSYLSSVENGKHNLTLSVALRLADALKVPLDLLIAERERG